MLLVRMDIQMILYNALRAREARLRALDHALREHAGRARPLQHEVVAVVRGEHRRELALRQQLQDLAETARVVRREEQGQVQTL